MSIVRTHKSRDYTVMCNHHLNNPKLSLKAKGLLSFMLSKPDKWDFSIAGLKSQLKEGKDSISATLQELIKHKYIVREQVVNTNGTFKGTAYHVYEKPITETPMSENPISDIPPQVNTNLSKDCKEVITEERKKDTKKPPFSFEDFWAVYDFKKGKALAEKRYSKLSDTDKQKIKDTLKFYLQETVTQDLKGNEFKPMRKQASTYITQEVWKDYEDVEDKSTELAEEFLRTKICMPNQLIELFGVSQEELMRQYKTQTEYPSQDGFDDFKIDFIKKKYSLD